MVVMNAVAPRGHGPAVALRTEIVLAFEGFLCTAFGQPSPLRRDLVHHPMHPGLSSGRVGVVADKRDLLRPFGQPAPPQGRGYVLPLSRVFPRDGAARFESGTRYLDTHGQKISQSLHRTYVGNIRRGKRTSHLRRFGLHNRFSSSSGRALLRHLPLLYAHVVVKTVVTRPRLEVLGRSLDHFRKKQ